MLILSPVPALQQFGITAVIAIGYSLIAAVVLVPPAMTLWGAYQDMRLRSAAQDWSRDLLDLDEAIEAIHRRHEEQEGASSGHAP